MIRISKKGVLIICCWKAVHPPLSLDVIRHKEGRLFLKKNYCIKFVFLYPSRKCILCRRIWCPFKVTYWYHFFSLICRYEEDEIHKLPENAVRPIARTALTWDQVSISFNSLSIHEDKFGNWWPENRGGGFGYRLSRLITMATCKQEPPPSPHPPPPLKMTLPKLHHTCMSVKILYPTHLHLHQLLVKRAKNKNPRWVGRFILSSLKLLLFFFWIHIYFLPPIGNVILLFSSLSPQISIGQIVMANYNPDEPDERGYWYDFKITKKVLRKWK